MMRSSRSCRTTISEVPLDVTPVMTVGLRNVGQFYGSKYECNSKVVLSLKHAMVWLHVPHAVVVLQVQSMSSSNNYAAVRKMGFKGTVGYTAKSLSPASASLTGSVGFTHQQGMQLTYGQKLLLTSSVQFAQRRYWKKTTQFILSRIHKTNLQCNIGGLAVPPGLFTMGSAFLGSRVWAKFNL